MEPAVFILAAGDDNSGLLHLANGRSILDWQVRAFTGSMPTAIPTVVVGADFSEIKSRFPELPLLHAHNCSNALQSFLYTHKKHPVDCISMYGDTVFNSGTIRDVVNTSADCVVVVDSTWESRFDGRTQADSRNAEIMQGDSGLAVEFTGLCKMTAEVVSWLDKVNLAALKALTFLDAFNAMRAAGFNIKLIDVCGDWAEMNDAADLAHFIMGTKAETLARLDGVLACSKVCKQVSFTTEEWRSTPTELIAKIQAAFFPKKLIVRSSSYKEDGWSSSNAGAYESVLDVCSTSASSVSAAIDRVTGSYEADDNLSQVLVQEFISDVHIAGVVFTCDLTTGAPYYILNYDDKSGRSDSVTSGDTEDLRMAVVLRSSLKKAAKIDPLLSKVLDAVKEIEFLLGYDRLDIEFAIDSKAEVYTFQVRPIVTSALVGVPELEFVLNSIAKGQKSFRRLQARPPQILGESTLFSGMTDWNPAEIIGHNPGSLAASLYYHLITSDNWAIQRHQYGYRDVRPTPLVHFFCGHPYVDCRASINSLVPAELTEELAEKLINIYIQHLYDSPHLHDKVELEVVFTVWVPNFKNEFNARFPNHQLSENELTQIEESLMKLTKVVFGRLQSDISSLATLSAKSSRVIDSGMSPLDKFCQLIEDCKLYGTLAFAHAARAGFVSITFLKNFVKLGILTESRMLQFQQSITTVTSSFQAHLSDGSISAEDLIEAYGHLRPGTYDIRQQAYWENPELYFGKLDGVQQREQKQIFNFSRSEIEDIDQVARSMSGNLSADEFIQFLIKGIQERERVKFEFTKNISKAFDFLTVYAESIGVSREQISNLTYYDLVQLRLGELDEQAITKFSKIRHSYSLCQMTKLPALIKAEDDFVAFEVETMMPNFVTRGRVTGELLQLTASVRDDIAGKIVVIESADPGYDWIFTHDILGLITKYGGANSHMAIRCAELDIPAAIGVGELLYERFTFGRAQIDCSRGTIERV